jgi:hypothetical protein
MPVVTEQEKDRLKRLLLWLDVTTKVVIAIVVIFTVFLLLVFPVGWVTTLSEHVGHRIGAVSQKIGGMGVHDVKLKIGWLELNYNQQSIQTNADLIGAATNVQALLDLDKDASEEVREKLASVKKALTVASSGLQKQQADINASAAAFAKPLPISAANIEGWLYLGLDFEGKWQPSARNVVPLDDPQSTQNIKSVRVSVDTPLVGSIESVKNEGAATSSSQLVQFVKAGTVLPVLNKPQRQPTIGSGQLVWVHVSVPAENIKQLGGN